MTNTVYASYKIPTSRVKGLEKAITKLANRITKGKTTADFPPAIEYTKEVIYVNGLPFSPDKTYKEDDKFVSYTWVTIKYNRPIINGWHLVCVYDWEYADGEEICYISTVPDQMVPKEYRNVDPSDCDHCNTKRRRNKSMLVTKDFLDFKIVGSTCVKDFLGHKNPKSFIDVFSFEMSIRKECERDATVATNVKEAVLPVKFSLELAAMMVRMFGYIKTNDLEKVPTASRVESYLYPYTNEHLNFIKNNKPTEYDIRVAEETAAWILKQSNSMEYFDNLQRIINAGAITWRRLGILASSIKVYQNNMERERKQAEVIRSNEWIGEPKERLRSMLAWVKSVKVKEYDMYTSTIITLETGKGDCRQ
jgi:hypothetical protein